MRFTIHPDTRKEELKRLLELNDRILEEVAEKGLWNKKGGKKQAYDDYDHPNPLIQTSKANEHKMNFELNHKKILHDTFTLANPAFLDVIFY